MRHAACGLDLDWSGVHTRDLTVESRLRQVRPGQAKYRATAIAATQGPRIPGVILQLAFPLGSLKRGHDTEYRRIQGQCIVGLDWALAALVPNTAANRLARPSRPCHAFLSLHVSTRSVFAVPGCELRPAVYDEAGMGDTVLSAIGSACSPVACASRPQSPPLDLVERSPQDDGCVRRCLDRKAPIQFQTETPLDMGGERDPPPVLHHSTHPWHHDCKHLAYHL